MASGINQANVVETEALTMEPYSTEMVHVDNSGNERVSKEDRDMMEQRSSRRARKFEV